MENLKLISAKIDPETLRKINEVKKANTYWRRNTIINGILTAVVDTFSPQEIYDMVRYSRHLNNDTEGTFKLWTPKK